jgi:hypothetical protein
MKTRQKAFFNKEFLGIGIDLDFFLPFNGRDRICCFQITLLYFRFWIVFDR